jgi:hypothetical protein
LSTVLIFSFLDFAVGFEVDHYPAIEFRGGFLKSQVDHPLYQGAIIAVMLDGCFPSYRLRSRRSLQQRMLASSADGLDGGINLVGCRHLMSLALACATAAMSSVLASRSTAAN